MLRQLVVQRLRRALLPSLEKAWKRDLEVRLKEVRHSVAEVRAELDDLRSSHQRLERVSRWNESRAAILETLDRRLNLDVIAAHVRRAVNAAAIVDDPTTHMVIEGLFPDDFYELLVTSIPPDVYFPARDPVKTDLEVAALPSAPRLTQRVWTFLDENVVRDVVAPAVFERLRPAIAEHYAETGGAAFGARAAAIPHQTTAGRIMLRRPGYRLKPHLDPKRVAATGLLYLAQPHDTEEYGTQLYRVDRPFVATGTKTFFPEAEGLRCEVARTVPFRANTLLAFVNSRAAHGAALPPDATLKERYSYQFYLKPKDGELKALLLELPAAQRVSWEEYLKH